MSLDNGDLPKPDVESGAPSTNNKEGKEATRKIIRVLTVLAYLSSVSMAAIMLSLYYIFLWNPPPPTPSAQEMPEAISFLALSSTETPHVPERLLNRTWEGPEEPRALPVQIAETLQYRHEEIANFHGDDSLNAWDDQPLYNDHRKRSTRDISKLLKIRNASTPVNT